jgi:hypothetical protein
VSKAEPVLNRNPALIETLSTPLDKDYCDIAMKKLTTKRKISGSKPDETNE